MYDAFRRKRMILISCLLDAESKTTVASISVTYGQFNFIPCLHVVYT